MTAWTKADTAKAISFLQLGYNTILTEARYTFYVEMLSDIPPLLVAVAVQKLINSSKFMPSIAEILRLDVCLAKTKQRNTARWILWSS